MGMDTPAFDKWFEQELKENKEFSARWHEYEAFYESNSESLGRRYQYQGSGDYNLFKLFIEAVVLGPARADGSRFSFHPASRRMKAAPHCGASCSRNTGLKN